MLKQNLKCWHALIFVLALCCAGAGQRYFMDSAVVDKYIDIKGSSAPAVSNSGQARLYVDSTTNSVKLSQNGNAFSTLSSGATIGRNKIIDGDFFVFQRGSPQTAIGSAYSFDRWKCSVGGTAKFTVATETSVVPTNVSNSGKFSCNATQADTAGLVCAVSQTIEGFNFAPLKGQVMTLSFWVRTHLTGTYPATFSVNFQNGGALNRSYTVEYTSSAIDTWEFKTITLTHDTTGSWNYDSSAGLVVNFATQIGSTGGVGCPTINLNSWQGSGYYGSINNYQMMTNTSNILYLAQVQLEAGSAATTFESLPYQQELALCQRYFYKTFNQATAPAQNVGGNTGEIQFIAGKAGANPEFGRVYFPVTMRTSTPTITTYNPQAGNTQVRDESAAADCSAVATQSRSDSQYTYTCSGAAGTAVGNLLGLHITADADF